MDKIILIFWVALSGLMASHYAKQDRLALTHLWLFAAAVAMIEIYRMRP